MLYFMTRVVSSYENDTNNDTDLQDLYYTVNAKL